MVIRQLRTKLFLAILGINALLIALMYGIHSISFQRGFGQYVGQVELEQYSAVIQQLAHSYQQQHSWQNYQQRPESFYELFRPYRHTHAQPNFPDHEPPKPPQDFFGDRRPLPPPDFDQPPQHHQPPHLRHLVLTDANQKPLMGSARLPKDAVLSPIQVDNQTVGYLAYLPQSDLIDSGSQIFLKQQQRIFALVALGMFIASALMAWLLARWLNRPLRELTRGTHELIAGHYQTQIHIAGADELAQLAQDFNQLANTLAANLAARQRWIADIAHELRTPLAVLRGEIEALQDGVRPASPQNLNSLAQEISRLTRLVEDLHLLSQSDQGSLSYRKEPLVLADELRDFFSQHVHWLQAAQIHYHLQADDDSLMHGDSERLAQLWTNLLQNTIRYTDPVGQLNICLWHDAHSVYLKWQDSSPSVAPEDLARLGERLFRVDSSRNRDSGGSGLGLAIAKAIVDGHGGIMTASLSALGGLCWDIQFPLYLENNAIGNNDHA